MLRCFHCTKEFKYESERKRHEQSHFPQFECQECLKKFSFLSALRRHQKQHARIGSVLCNECGRSFRDDSLLLRHFKYAHKGTYICTKCHAKFSSELALASHSKTHKPKSERRFQCSYDGCNKSFNFMHHKKHHELTHTDFKQYHCKACGKGFIQAHHLKSHLKSHDPENWLHCNILNCKKSFATDYSLRRHLSTHKTVPDSGISSDSSSDVHQDRGKDLLLCASCGELLSKSSQHECLQREKHEEDVTIYSKTNDDTYSDFSNIEIGKDDLENWASNEDLSSLSFEIKSVESNGEPSCNANLHNKICCNGKIKPSALPELKPTRNSREDCNNNCNHVSGPLKKSKTICDVSNVEYRSDGTIKIKNTFDLDFEITRPIEINNVKKIINDVPYNSCKDVLGKCIVSGNGTISDECLCAKMVVNDEEIVEQEIDEITPQPAVQF